MAQSIVLEGGWPMISRVMQPESSVFGRDVAASLANTTMVLHVVAGSAV